MDTAFTALRGYSRDHNAKLSLVAQSLVRRALPRSTVLGAEQRSAGGPT